jgi:oligopeptide transport system ATP-binding protein
MAEVPLLAISDLSVSYATEYGEVTAVRAASLDVLRGECLGVVGESGSGKTQLLLATLGLLADSARARGSIRFNGQELLHRPARELDRVRGRHIAMVFQDPMTALNPYLRIGIQITEGLQAHQDISRGEATQRAVALLESLRLTDAAGRMRQYPHQLSGGMRQRIVIAMALINEPDLLLADEPTTALDVTVQAQILEILARRRERSGTSILLVTHDLGVIARLADRVAVMYAGRVVEQASASELFARPMHPYTEGLVLATPRLDGALPARLATIAGTPPPPSASFTGCAFAARCRYRMPICDSSSPELRERAAGHWAACHRDPP